MCVVGGHSAQNSQLKQGCRPVLRSLPASVEAYLGGLRWLRRRLCSPAGSTLGKASPGCGTGLWSSFWQLLGPSAACIFGRSMLSCTVIYMSAGTTVVMLCSYAFGLTHALMCMAESFTTSRRGASPPPASHIV